jgi:kynurenine formamidase
MTVYPGDPEVRVAAALTLEGDGVAVTGVTMGSHTGTHLDAPSHTVPGGRTLDQISLDELCGEALVIRVADAQPRQELGAAELGLDGLDSVPEIVAVHTGWDRYFAEDRYREHPFLAVSAVRQLCDLGMRVLAVDTLNPDQTPADGAAVDATAVGDAAVGATAANDAAAVDAAAVDAAADADFPVHEVLLGSNRLIVENLRGLELVPDRVRIGFFPLPLGAVDGAPVRAVAFYGGD